MSRTPYAKLTIEGKPEPHFVPKDERHALERLRAAATLFSWRWHIYRHDPMVKQEELKPIILERVTLEWSAGCFAGALRCALRRVSSTPTSARRVHFGEVLRAVREASGPMRGAPGAQGQILQVLGDEIELLVSDLTGEGASQAKLLLRAAWEPSGSPAELTAAVETLGAAWGGRASYDWLLK